MKTVVLLVVGAALLSGQSAHAIDAKYREQLERSGCTQVSEAQGCDINKTKAENAKAGFVVEDPAHDAKVKGTPYHATGKISCAMGDAELGSVQCDFGVIRGKPGNAEVHIIPPGGFERILSFSGEKVSADKESIVKATRSGDDWLVEVNGYEHYKIPSAVIYGG